MNEKTQYIEVPRSLLVEARITTVSAYEYALCSYDPNSPFSRMAEASVRSLKKEIIALNEVLGYGCIECHGVSTEDDELCADCDLTSKEEAFAHPQLA